MKCHIAETPEATAHELIRSLLADMATSDAPYSVAFSGGNTPALLFDLWAQHYPRLTPWDRLRIFFVDERCVDWSSPESNYGNMKLHLLHKVPVPAENVFPIDGIRPPAEVAAFYSDLMGRELPLENGKPTFDAVILGMGDDGHTSSIFPGQEQLLEEERYFVESRNPYSGQLRVAMTPVLMWAAKRLIFHVTGANKAPVLARLMEDPLSGPAARIAHRSEKAEFFVDAAAAAELP